MLRPEDDLSELERGRGPRDFLRRHNKSRTCATPITNFTSTTNRIGITRITAVSDDSGATVTASGTGQSKPAPYSPPRRPRHGRNLDANELSEIEGTVTEDRGATEREENTSSCGSGAGFCLLFGFAVITIVILIPVISVARHTGS